MINSYVETDDVMFWENLEKENITSKKVRKFDPKNPIPFQDEYLGHTNTKNVVAGDVITGKISKVSGKDLVIEFGYKDNIYVRIKPTDIDIIQNLSYGDDIDVLITEVKENPYEIKGSITELLRMNVTNKLKDCFHENEGFDAVVREIIPAGFMLDIFVDDIKMEAFMPNTLADVNKLTEIQSQALVGKTIKVMLESLHQEKGVYVVSRRKYLKTQIPLAIEDLKIGDQYTGTVTGTIDFGVFVQFNECLTGMIHELNINPDYKLSDIKEGMEIDFYLRDILKNKNGGYKLMLSQVYRKTLWDSIKVGQTISGTVKAIKHFGALVTLDEETIGLVQNTYIKRLPKELVKGEKIDVKVISVIKDERKIYLDIVTK
ncbi:S1 RNA-binding domain-containing protein [bacterium]|jgi:ribosomal protein S1|nr:S1 RNA-binding domain-containing protein [bacterium]